MTQGSAVEAYLQQLYIYEADTAFIKRSTIVITEIVRYKPKRILDVGCGRGWYSKVLADLLPESEIYGIELNEKYLQIAKKVALRRNTHFVKGDAHHMPFQDKYFDAIICSEVLEHVLHDEIVVSEMKRVLAKGGIIIATVPHKNFPFLWDPLNFLLGQFFNTHVPSHIWWLAGIWADHVRLYRSEAFRSLFERSGFAIIKEWQTSHFCFPFSHFLLYGIGKNLVEKGFLKGSINRFTFRKQNSLIYRLLTVPFKLALYLEDVIRIKPKRSVNLVIEVKKTR